MALVRAASRTTGAVAPGWCSRPRQRGTPPGAARTRAGVSPAATRPGQGVIGMSGIHLPWPSLASARRWLGLDANPVRRASDRAEAWIRVGLLIVFLVAAPVTAVVFAGWTGASMTREARAQSAALHLVPATLLRDAPGTGRYPGTSSGFSWVPARWPQPGGGQHTGRVEAVNGARKGSVVQVWTGTGGRLVNPPIAHAQVISRVVTVAALTPVAVALVLLTVAGLIHQVLERRRLAAWEADWDTVEPQWTRRLN